MAHTLTHETNLQSGSICPTVISSSVGIFTLAVPITLRPLQLLESGLARGAETPPDAPKFILVSTTPQIQGCTFDTLQHHIDFTWKRLAEKTGARSG
jgi:hypothetical protein